jgi:ankyrin repeat protein
VENGADVNRRLNDGFFPLFLASSKGYFKIVKLLVENGADINQCVNYGYSPLMIASEYNHFKIVKFLVESGADLSLESDNLTAMDIAENHEHGPIARFLGYHKYINE